MEHAGAIAPEKPGHMAAGGPIQTAGIRHDVNRSAGHFEKSPNTLNRFPAKTNDASRAGAGELGREVAGEHLDTADPFGDGAENGHDAARHQRLPSAARQHPFSHTRERCFQSCRIGDMRILPTGGRLAHTVTSPFAWN
jgi:hypothetical protein